MAWFIAKNASGNFLNFAGAVNKLQESEKNIEKNFDTALSFEEKGEFGHEGSFYLRSVNKLQESEKNIEKSFDTAFGFEEKGESSNVGNFYMRSVNKLQESEKNIEKNSDTALGFQEKGESDNEGSFYFRSVNKLEENVMNIENNYVTALGFEEKEESNNEDSILELERVKRGKKMTVLALQGAARQAQANADEIAKLMSENKLLKALIEDLKLVEMGRKPSRGELYLETHKPNESFVNDKAKATMEQIQTGLTQSSVDESEISPDDVIGRVLGPEHSGRVRCMGMGAVASNTFRNKGVRLSNLSNSSAVASTSSNTDWKAKFTSLESAFKAYIIMKEGRIPDEVASFFGPSNSSDLASEPNSPLNGRGSCGGSNI